MGHQKNHPIQDVPADLLNKVLHRIVQAERWETTKRRMGMALVVLIAMGILMIPAWISFQSDLTQTGFVFYVGLLFPDFHHVMMSWQDFVLSLIESFPLFGGITVLFLTFCFLWALQYLMPHKIQSIPRALSVQHHQV
jgi:low temperature requirement protein LtrA